MNRITNNLSTSLAQHIKSADEIWIAVALINPDGLNFIQEKINKNAIQHFLVGIDLPTSPLALKRLYELQYNRYVKVKVFSSVNSFFHPKVYIFRTKKSYSAFIGSANCTNGGLMKNIELSVHTSDINNCENVLQWFNTLYSEGKFLTKRFINIYEKNYAKRLDRKKANEKIAKQEKNILNQEHEIVISEKRKFLSVLKKYRKEKLYTTMLKDRASTIKEIRNALDYPKFTNPDIDYFFSILELGHIIEISKPAVKREKKKFIKLLKWLCDEKVDIVTRYDRALTGDLKVTGVSEAFLSKILIAHNPTLYFVKNLKSMNTLKKYGIDFPRGLTKGQRYKITCDTLKTVCKEANFKNLAVLDYYLYLESSDY